MCTVRLHADEYTVVKHQKAFGNSPGVVPDTVAAGGNVCSLFSSS